MWSFTHRVKSSSSLTPMSTWDRLQSLFICLAGSVFSYRRDVCVMDRWLFEEQLVAVSRWRAPNIYVCGGQSPLQTSPFAAQDQKVKWAVNVSHNPPTHSCSIFCALLLCFGFPLICFCQCIFRSRTSK